MGREGDWLAAVYSAPFTLHHTHSSRPVDQLRPAFHGLQQTRSNLSNQHEQLERARYDLAAARYGID